MGSQTELNGDPLVGSNRNGLLISIGYSQRGSIIAPPCFPAVIIMAMKKQKHHSESVRLVSALAYQHCCSWLQPPLGSQRARPILGNMEQKLSISTWDRCLGICTALQKQWRIVTSETLLGSAGFGASWAIARKRFRSLPDPTQHRATSSTLMETMGIVAF